MPSFLTLYHVNRNNGLRSVVYWTGVDSRIAWIRPSHEKPTDGVSTFSFRLDALFIYFFFKFKKTFPFKIE